MSRYESEADIAKDALLIWAGASNPQGVARALVEMIDWYVKEHDGHPGVKTKDGFARAPVVLVQGQLLFLLGMGPGDVNGADMGKAQQECERLKEQG